MTKQREALGKTFTLDEVKLKEHFTEGQIKGFMRDLGLSYLETIFYLWLFNNVGIQIKELTKDCGRAMYLKFAKATAKVFKELERCEG